MKVDDKTLGKLMKRIPKFMNPDLSRVETLEDLRFQIQHEIDLAEEDEIHYTKTQMHRAKMFFADVHLAAEEFAREYPELVDDLNHADGSHTEGPWKYTTNVGPTKALIVEADGSTIVEVGNRTHDSRFLARVRLMTAAPRLLEALRAIEAGFADGSIRFTKKRQSDRDPYHPANTLMCEAIAAATEGN